MTSLLDLSYIQHITGEQLLVTDTSGTPLEVIGNVKWVSKTILLCTSISILSTQYILLDGCSAADGLPSLLQQQPLPAAGLHTAALLGPLIRIRGPADTEENCVRKRNWSEGLNSECGDVED